MKEKLERIDNLLSTITASGITLMKIAEIRILLREVYDMLKENDNG